MKSDKIVEKLKSSNLKNYGFENISQVIDKKENIKKKHLENGFTKYLEKLEETEYRFHNIENEKYEGLGNEYTFYHKKCGEEFVDRITYDKPLPICNHCYPKIWGSSFEGKGLIDFIKTICNDVEENNRKLISPKEVDIFIPSKHIAIEYSGLYWHSDYFKKDKWYHYNKWKECNDKGIRLITIWDSEWKFKKEKVKSRLIHILGNEKGIGARKCVIREIDTKEAIEFCETNHLHGYTKSSVKLGAFYEDELVGVMTFGKRKITGGISEWEIMRFCTSCNVVGLASKFVKYFKKTYSPEKLVSYSDNRWDTGKVYENIGFVQTNTPNPGYWYTSNFLSLEHRYKFRKKRLVEQGADSSLTEKEIMDSLGYSRVWDCGVRRWELKF